MKSKKIMGIVLTAAMAMGILMAPATKLAAEAGEFVSVNNQASGISRVAVQTPENTMRLYVGMSWQELDMRMKLRLNVTDGKCGPLAQTSLSNRALALGASEEKLLDMDLEKCLNNSGWTSDIDRTVAPIRVCITLPADSDPAKDYAVISLREEGAVEVLGDLDADPKTITVDSDYFNLFMIVSAPKGTFDAYRIESPNALDVLEIPVYVRKIGSTVPILKEYPMGVLTDALDVRAAAGGKNVTLEIKELTPGASAMYAIDNAVKSTNAENKRKAASKADGSDEVVPVYHEMDMKGAGKRITDTTGKLRLTIGIPYYFPAYADYAAAVLNMDGTVTIMKDIDENPSTITIDTDQFRTYMFLWGKEGAFDEQPSPLKAQ